MNSFISKKVTVIYRANNFFLILVFFFVTLSANAGTDLNSYCFNKSVNLKEVQSSLGFLLLPGDLIDLREVDHCIDIVLSPDRGKLFEKYLARRYNLKRDSLENSPDMSGDENAACRLSLKTTTKEKRETNIFKLGEKNVLNKAEGNSSSVSTMELLLGKGIPGEIEAGPEKLKVTCRLVRNEKAYLVFSYVDKNKASASTEVNLTKGEWLNIASVTKELNDKNRTLGIPQTEISDSTGFASTIYELQFK